MADTNNAPVVRVEDLLPVRSRVSWGAIFAGAVVAMAVYIVLTLLAGAIGMSVRDNVRDQTWNIGAAVCAVFATIAALFVGGWVTTQCTVGENKTEAVVHGVIMWGAVMAMILWLVATGIRTGFNAMMGVAYAGAVATRDATQEDWEAAARRAGVSQQQIDEWKQKAREAAADARREVTDPENRELAAQYATQATWWTLLGTLLSMAAAIGGALVGAGPTFRLRAVPVGVSGYRVREEVHQSVSV